jgi:hypothetical protein
VYWQAVAGGDRVVAPGRLAEQESIAKVSNNSSNAPSKNRLAQEGCFWDACVMTFKIRRLQNVDSGGALSSAVEHYLHTIKREILARFSHLFPALIYIASDLRSIR